MSLFHEFREFLTPKLAATIESNREFVDPTNLEAVLKKDAIYNAFGLTAFEMFDIVSTYIFDYCRCIVFIINFIEIALGIISDCLTWTKFHVIVFTTFFLQKVS